MSRQGSVGSTTDILVWHKITSYSVLASEHSAFECSQGVKSSKTKPKGDRSSDSDDSSNESDRAPAKKGSKKVMDALFRVKWWRIVLGP